MNKAEQLIACLEGEIAKRDARIAELHNDASYYAARNEELRAELAAIKAQDTVGEVVGWYRLDRPYETTSYPSICATWRKLGAPVAPLYSDPAAPAADAGLVEALEKIVATAFNWRESGARAMGNIAVEAIAAHRAAAPAPGGE